MHENDSQTNDNSNKLENVHQWRSSPDDSDDDDDFFVSSVPIVLAISKT